jgi:hypothetical protein
VLAVFADVCLRFCFRICAVGIFLVVFVFFLLIFIVRVCGEILTVACLAKILDGPKGNCPVAAIHSLQRQLKAVEEKRRAMAVNGVVDDGAEDLRDRDLDCATVFKEGDFD